MEIQFKRPVMLGVALTNRPHVRLRNHPIKVMEDGRIRVPFMVQGAYKHPFGDMSFTSDVYKAFLENQEKRVADFDLGADTKHLPELGAWIWFEKQLGGEVVEELDSQTGDKLLVGYGWPTNEDIKKRLENGQFRFASLEFHPNYRSNVKTTYLSSDFIEEEVMSVSQEEFDGLKATNVKLEDTNQTLTTRISELTDELAKLKAALDAKDETQEDKMTERELQLHNRLITLERQTVEQHVSLVIERAKNRVDENGYALPAVLLNLAHDLMLGKGMDGVVALSEADYMDAGKIAGYFRSGMEKLLLTMPIVAPKVEGKTIPDNERKLEADNSEDMFEQGKSVGANFWATRGGI